MIDVAVIRVKGGDGGNGSVSFRREKYVSRGGPDGGDGGDGGSIILRSNNNLRTLDRYVSQERFAAENGKAGMGKKMFGRDGEHLYLDVPLGTVVYEIAGDKGVELASLEKRAVMDELTRVRTGGEKAPDRLGFRLVMMGELTKQDDEMVVGVGGEGGRGNDRFKSSANQAPMEAESGKPGEVRWLVLELKMLADVGLIGFPNVGKSTLLSVLTAARPKIANYEFTTLEPNLGIWKKKGMELVIADIPGLIEGASKGRGLGDEFLRHVERCRVLIHLLAIRDYGELSAEKVSEERDERDGRRGGLEIARTLWEDYVMINKELSEYHASLAEKPQIVVLNKADVLGEVQESEVVKFFEEKGVVGMLVISAVTKDRLAELENAMMKMV